MSDSGYKRSPERQAVVDALLADQRRRLDQLCERLGIVTFRGYSEKWALVGMELANKEPEFRPRGRGRGRPKMDDRKNGIDVRRAALVIEIAKSMAGYQGLPPLSRARWVREIKKCVDNGRVAGMGRHLFGTTEKALQRSVRRQPRRRFNLRNFLRKFRIGPLADLGAVIFRNILRIIREMEKPPPPGRGSYA